MISCTLRIKYKPILSFLVATFLTFSVFAQGEQADVAKEGVTAGAPAAQAAGGDPALISAGDALFKNNCASCHALDEVVVGPALRGVTKKRNQAWLINWIKNSSKMVQSGDKEAVAIFNEYQKQQMPSFAFSDDEIKSILAYVDAAPAATAATNEDDAGGGQGQIGEKGVGAGIGNDVARYMDILLIVLVVVLIVMVITLVIIATVLSNYLKKNRQLSEEDNEVLNQRFDFGKILKSKVVRGLALAIFVVALLDLTLDKVMGVGIQ